MSSIKLLLALLILLSAAPIWAEGVLTLEGGPLSGGAGGTSSTLYDYTTGFTLQDDFFGGNVTIGSVGTLGWSVGGGATTTSPVSEANHPGIIQRSTGTSSGLFAYLHLPHTQGALLAGSYDLTYLVRLNTNDANTTTRVGAMYLINTTPTDGVYFEKKDVDTNWFVVTRAASTETRTDSGVAIDTDWVTFRIVQTATASVAFYLDGALVATSTTNIPTAQGLSVGLQIVNSTTAAKTIDIDYFQMAVTGMTR